MGRPKPLLEFGSTTAIELLVATLVSAGMKKIVVVLGPGGEPVAGVLQPYPVTLAWNRQPGSDMAASLREGLGQLGDTISGVLVALADHPLVAVATVAALSAAHRRDSGSILVPTCEGRRGHPLLLPRTLLQELTVLPTLRHVVNRDPGRVLSLPVVDPGILLDLDTPTDYGRGLEFYRNRRRA